MVADLERLNKCWQFSFVNTLLPFVSVLPSFVKAMLSVYIVRLLRHFIVFSQTSWIESLALRQVSIQFDEPVSYIHHSARLFASHVSELKSDFCLVCSMVLYIVVHFFMGWCFCHHSKEVQFRRAYKNTSFPAISASIFQWFFTGQQGTSITLSFSCYFQRILTSFCG